MDLGAASKNSITDIEVRGESLLTLPSYLIAHCLCSCLAVRTSVCPARRSGQMSKSGHISNEAFHHAQGCSRVMPIAMSNGLRTVVFQPWRLAEAVAKVFSPGSPHKAGIDGHHRYLLRPLSSYLSHSPLAQEGSPFHSRPVNTGVALRGLMFVQITIRVISKKLISFTLESARTSSVCEGS